MGVAVSAIAARHAPQLAPIANFSVASLCSRFPTHTPLLLLAASVCHLFSSHQDKERSSKAWYVNC